MKISGSGDTLQTARVTGPTHNFLRLTFAVHDGRSVRPNVIVDEPPALLTEDEVCAAVLQGSEDAGGLADLGLRVASILYVGSDTPAALTYRALAKVLVERKRSDVLRDGIDAERRVFVRAQA